MLLAVFDVGNTRIHAALFAPTSAGVRLIELRHAAVLPGSVLRRWRAPVAEAVFASVRPAADRPLERAVRSAWGVPLKRMLRDFPPGIPNHTRKPDETGADRLANAVAAWHRCGRACVVADVGTAVTFDVVDSRGRFRGGAISPGRILQARALHRGTAALPDVPPGKHSRIGRTTREAIRAGIDWGISGLLREGRRRISAELGGRPRFIGTGGDADRYAGLFDEVVPELTLEGVALSWLAFRRARHG